MTAPKLALTLFSVLLALLLGAALLPMRTVGSDEMAWTLRQGDRVWIAPVRVRKGDIVLLADPLDPARTVLRRVIAIGGEKVLYEDGGVRVNGKRVRQKDMGKVGDTRILEETIWSKPPARATTWLISRPLTPAPWKMAAAVEVPDGHLYLLADARDAALDSRWWGPVPEPAVKGVVRARLGASDEWRERLQWIAPIE